VSSAQTTPFPLTKFLNIQFNKAVHRGHNTVLEPRGLRQRLQDQVRINFTLTPIITSAAKQSYDNFNLVLNEITIEVSGDGTASAELIG